MNLSGGVAQLGERGPCKAEVSGSIPLISIFLLIKIVGSSLLYSCKEVNE